MPSSSPGILPRSLSMISTCKQTRSIPYRKASPRTQHRVVMQSTSRVMEKSADEKHLSECGIPLAWGPWKYATDWTFDQLTATIKGLNNDPIAGATKLEQYWLLHCLHPQELSPAEVTRFNRVRDSSDARHQIDAMSRLSLSERTSSSQTSFAQARESTAVSSMHHAPDNTPDRECSWCGEMKSAASMLDGFNTSSCIHPSPDPPCRCCAQKYITQQAASEDWTKIRCPAYQCKEVFQHEDMQAYASKADLAQYEVILAKRAVGSDYHNCARRGCEGGGLCNPDVDSFFICSTCGGKTCASCQREWHTGKTCAQHQAEEEGNTLEAVAATRAARKGEEERSARTVRHTSVPCPNPHVVCPHWIQKSTGCDHMRCEYCPSSLLCLVKTIRDLT